MKRILSRAGLLLALTASTPAMAQLNCTYGASNGAPSQPRVTVSPLQGVNITVGRDVPLGTEIHRQTIDLPSVVMVCKAKPVTYYYRTYRVTKAPLPLSSWSGSPWGGSVYETGVPGIGVAITHLGIRAYPSSVYLSQTHDEVQYTLLANAELSFVKIGDVQPGTIHGSMLPSIESLLSGYRILSASFSGSLNIVSSTCNMQADKTVDLGSHKLSDLVANGTTDYRPFSIRLDQCPAFHGTFREPNGPVWDGSSFFKPGIRTPNRLGYRLDPVRPPIDPASGFIALNDSPPGDAPSATGLGIQISRRDNSFVSLGVIHKLQDIPPGTPAGRQFEIPLQARYRLISGATPTPGPARGSIVFTIDYQ